MRRRTGGRAMAGRAHSFHALATTWHQGRAGLEAEEASRSARSLGCWDIVRVRRACAGTGHCQMPLSWPKQGPRRTIAGLAHDTRRIALAVPHQGPPIPGKLNGVKPAMNAVTVRAVDHNTAAPLQTQGDDA